MNKVILCGNIGKEPELKHVGENNTALIQFSLATSEWDAKKKESISEWHNIVAWSKMAENVAKHCTKGTTICVSGKIKTETYDKDGEKRYSTKIIADQIEFIKGTKKKDDDNGLDDIPFGDF